jgi:hypothetical protein
MQTGNIHPRADQCRDFFLGAADGPMVQMILARDLVYFLIGFMLRIETFS